MQTRVKFAVLGRIDRDFALSHALTALGLRLSFSRSITLNRDQFGLVRPTSRSSAFAHFRLSTRNVLFSDGSPAN